MIEIDGEFFNDIDYDAETERKKLVTKIALTTIEQIARVVKSGVIDWLMIWQIRIICECAKFSLLNVEKYPNRWKGEFVTVNNGKPKPIITLDGKTLFDDRQKT